MSGEPEPRVSVIIPVFNGEKYVSQAIQSALDQTYQNIEILVVDDGSTDGSWNLITSFGEKIHAVRKKNGGVSSALNEGICLSGGEYIAWLSHDDLFQPAKIEKQVAVLEANNQYAACYTDFAYINSTGEIIEQISTPWYPRPLCFRMLYKRMYIMGSTILIRKSCLESVGLFSEELRYTSDAEMWLRLLKIFDIGHVPEILGSNRIHVAQQGTRQQQRFTAEAGKMYKKMFGEIGIANFFPKLSGRESEPRSISIALNWLGDTLLNHEGDYAGWYDFAGEQYNASLRVYPDLSNPARLKLARLAGQKFLLPLRRIVEPRYRFIKRKLRQKSKII